MRKQLRRQAIIAAAHLRAATGPGPARSAAVDARAARIREAAAIHSWIHSPAVLRVEDLTSGRRTWRCGRCEVALPCLTAALPVYRSRGMCGKAARTLAPSVGTRRQIVDALGLMLPKRAARAERHLPAAGTAGSRPYRSADVSFRCECGWGPPSGSRRVSTLVAAHLRAHGCPRPRPACALTPAARALGAVAGQSLRDAQWADWLAIAPGCAHRGHKLSRQVGGPKCCRLQHHCLACDAWLPTPTFRLRPCYAAAGFTSGNSPAYQAALPGWTIQLRQLWKQARDAAVQSAREARRDALRCRLALPTAGCC